MDKGFDEIWYACYGSNIRKGRFLCYINGGTPPGAVRNFTGCSDKSEPKESRKISIRHEMYFAKESVTWNGGGICFLKVEEDPQVETFGRTYLITSGQFIDLVKQELIAEENIEIDFEKLVKEGSYTCMEGGRYGELLYLGELEGRPVVTFTSKVFLKDEINPPNAAYLSTIIAGLLEIYDFKKSQLIEYFQNKPGIRGQAIENELPGIVKEML